MKKVLCVIDMQEDFVNGCLGSNEAKAIVPEVVALVDAYKKQGDLVIFTKDTHQSNYLETQEGKFLPVPHCLQGTSGHDLIDALKDLSKDAIIIEKPTFGSRDLVDYLKGQSFLDITLIGVCTDICVISNALLLKQAFPEVPMYIVEKACAGVNVEKHQAALETARSCQIQVI